MERAEIGGSAGLNPVSEFSDPAGKYRLVSQGAFPAVEVHVSQEDGVHVELGGMLTMSEHVRMGLAGGGGTCCDKITRACCAGEMPWVSTFHGTGAPSTSPATVLVAPGMPGEFCLLHVDCPEERRSEGTGSWRVSPGAFLASDPMVQVGTQVQSCGKICCGEPPVLLQAYGVGRIVCNAYGAVMRYDLGEGERKTFDNGMLVAWSGDMEYSLECASPSWITSCISGEGMVCKFIGPGTVYVHTRAVGGLASAIARFLPTQISPPKGGGEAGGGG